MPKVSPPSSATESTEPPCGLVGKRVLVVYESGSAGAAAVELAHRLVQRGDCALTVVGVVPQAPGAARCEGSAVDYNRAVCSAVENELQQAREQLGHVGAAVVLRLLVEGIDPPLHAFAAAADFDLVLLPARRQLLRAAGHPAAARLRSTGRAEVQIVSPGNRS